MKRQLLHYITETWAVCAGIKRTLVVTLLELLLELLLLLLLLLLYYYYYYYTTILLQLLLLLYYYYYYTTTTTTTTILYYYYYYYYYYYCCCYLFPVVIDRYRLPLRRKTHLRRLEELFMKRRQSVCFSNLEQVVSGQIAPHSVELEQ